MANGYWGYKTRLAAEARGPFERLWATSVLMACSFQRGRKAQNVIAITDALAKP